MKLQHLPKREFEALRGAGGAKSVSFDDLQPKATVGRVEVVPMPLALRLHVTNWQAEKGGKLKFSVPVEKDGRYTLHLIAIHQPGGASLRATLDGKPLMISEKTAQFSLTSPHHFRDLNVDFLPVDVKAGSHEIELECIEPGPVGLDLIWIRPE